MPTMKKRPSVGRDAVDGGDDADRHGGRRSTRSGIAGASALKIVSMTVIGKVIHQRIGAGRSALITRARRHDDIERAEAAVVDRIVGRRGQAFVGDLGAGDSRSSMPEL